ncbi:Protein CBG10233 [Caenorhabditis briggsae]|uniref:Protein CBG10233 n=1 Tax=Caenorhabditis briggsae TaxID=6238 RepID=A8XAT1_CAEBR|nr:Protein CBG10233 [Caenorhabditis briggsae]CAP29746.2 Protein CBG10233 [Caenorhabditis briggsae]
MLSLANNCSICGRFTTDFNYGVLSCNACKVFFRRMITRTAPLRKCHLGERCFDSKPNYRNTQLIYCFPDGRYNDKNKYLNCQFCRFQKCLRNKMTLPSYLLFTDQNKKKCLEAVIASLNEMDIVRGKYLIDFITPTGTDLSINEILNMEKVIYMEKPAGHPMNFPDGTDLLPKTEWPNPRISPKLENRIRSRLVGRLAELNVTHEEFLLLSVLLFCNPAISNLSENGKFLLGIYQNMYGAALLQYCLYKYQHNGPARYADLLGFYSVIGKHYDDVIQYYVLLQVLQSTVEVKKIVQDGIEAAYRN